LQLCVQVYFGLWHAKILCLDDAIGTQVAGHKTLAQNFGSTFLMPQMLISGSEKFRALYSIPL